MKEFRFRRPEFQEELARARRFARKQQAIPEKFGQRLLLLLGLGSRLSRYIFGLILLAAVYFLTVSNFFLVSKVSLGQSTLRPEQVSEVLQKMKQQRYYLVPRNHILLINRSSFLEGLKQELPQIRAVTSFKRIPPDKIEATLEERQPVYVWQSGGNYYLLDQDGVIFQKILKFEQTAYPSQILITDRLEEEVRVGQELEIQKILNFTGELRNLWGKQIPQTGFLSLATPAVRSPDIFVKTAIGFWVYFDLDRKAQGQLKNLNLLLSQEIKPETYSGLSYIDLRLPDNAYYCYKDAPCAIESELRVMN